MSSSKLHFITVWDIACQSELQQWSQYLESDTSGEQMRADFRTDDTHCLALDERYCKKVRPFPICYNRIIRNCSKEIGIFAVFFLKADDNQSCGKYY